MQINIKNPENESAVMFDSKAFKLTVLHIYTRWEGEWQERYRFGPAVGCKNTQLSVLKPYQRSSREEFKSRLNSWLHAFSFPNF